MCERFSDIHIKKLNAKCSEIKGAGKCSRSCDSIGWCDDAWAACSTCPRLGASVTNGTRAARDAVDLVLSSFYFKDNYPIDEAGEYLADLEALSDELEKVADWVVIDWQGGNASASTLEHDWGMVVDMCLDAYIHVNPESNEDMKRLPSYLNKHVEWLTAIKRDLSRAVAPGSLGVPRVRAPDCESV